MRLPSTNFVRISLAAAVLAASAMPPAIRHAHPGGDRPHRHAAADHPHGEAHRHGRHAGHRHTVSEESSRSCGKTPPATSALSTSPHVHWTLLGLQVTFPGSDRESPVNPELPTDCGVTVVVRLVDERAVDADTAPVAGFPRPADAGMSLPEQRPALSERPSCGSLASPAPLCDAARGERSGVQVI